MLEWGNLAEVSRAHVLFSLFLYLATTLVSDLCALVPLFDAHSYCLIPQQVQPRYPLPGGVQWWLGQLQ